MAIEISEERDAEAWDRFLLDQPSASFYHLAGWHGINEEQLGHRCFQLAARRGGQIVGVLPLVLVRSQLFGRILCSMPFVNFGGPVATDKEVELQLVRAAIARADELQVDYLEMRCTAQLDLGLPASLRKISMTIELAADPDVLWNGFTSKHRKNVKRAYKNDLQTTIGGVELLPVFYQVMEESWRTLGTPLYKRDYFERVLRTFPEQTRVFLCHRAGEPIAVALTGYYNGVVEGLWAGGRPAARELDANYVLYWEMIRDACQRGMHHFHLGRSSADSGGEEFKRKWNATAQQLYWYFHRPNGGPMPALNVDNPKYRLAIAAWRKLPLGITRLVGPPIARLIP